MVGLIDFQDPSNPRDPKQPVDPSNLKAFSGRGLVLTPYGGLYQRLKLLVNTDFSKSRDFDQWKRRR
jgi:hypothetical protein